MAADYECTDPTTHPKFQREHRQITAILVSILVRGGRSESDAANEARALLAPIPPGRQLSWRNVVSKRKATA